MKKRTVLLTLLTTTLVLGLGFYSSKTREVQATQKNDLSTNTENKTNDDKSKNTTQDETIEVTQLENAILNEGDIFAENNRYLYFLDDLNSDGTNEVITYLFGNDFSGTGGATMMIFEKNNNNYQLISKTTVTNMPIRISQNKTNGYKDIIVNTHGGGASSNDVILKFNNGYPLNASIQPTVNINEINIEKTINEIITPESGYQLKIK